MFVLFVFFFRFKNRIGSVTHSSNVELIATISKGMNFNLHVQMRREESTNMTKLLLFGAFEFVWGREEYKIQSA